MFKCLNASLIGVKAMPIEAVRLAAAHGFTGVDLNVAQVDDASALAATLDAHGLRRGLAGGLLPGKTTVPDVEWAAAVGRLPALAGTAASAGFTRSMIVVLPFHEELPFGANLALHVKRLSQVAPIFADHGVRLGLEYVSQKTRRAGYPHAFVHDLRGTLRVTADVGHPAIGVMLDSFHWYCARETPDVVRRLSREQVVGVHVNDAIAGRTIDEQLAMERELPRVNGHIDSKAFLTALHAIGYDGPVTAEPMNKTLEALPEDAAMRMTSRAMDAAFEHAGIGDPARARPAAD